MKKFSKKDIAVIIFGIILLFAGLWGGSFLVKNLSSDYSFASGISGLLTFVAGVVCIGGTIGKNMD